jgi:TonB family protein
MSYKALLFCPEDKTARAVTQVLSELDFSVERAVEPFGTVKKLTDQQFDALVVDCQNEQDAALLFKSARNSSFNHSSLSVAVVEGQAGVAKAFRIGANLVLTKPINVEQSKSTLRVARGLLKKTEAKSAAASAGVAPAMMAGPALFPPKPPAAVAAPTTHSSPFSALELDQEEAPAVEAAEAAVLESLPNTVKPATPAPLVFAPAAKNSAEPIAASTSTASGAAAAPALAKAPLEIKPSPPLANHDAIMSSDFAAPVSETSTPAPSFASYGQPVESSNNKKFVAIAAVVVLAAGLGYFALRKPSASQSLHRAPGEGTRLTRDASPAIAAPEDLTPGAQNSAAGENLSPAGNSTETAPVQSTARPLHPTPIETIEVEEAPADGKITVVPKPLVVSTKPASPPTQKLTQETPAPPTLEAENAPDSALASLVSTSAALPKAAPGSVKVSQGVSQGLLVKRVSPVYPAIALQLKKQGAVELLAHITKSGDISAIQVVSGDATLARAATEAVRQWKYRPYLLNGEPVEIETQITVKFNLPRS